MSIVFLGVLYYRVYKNPSIVGSILEKTANNYSRTSASTTSLRSRLLQAAITSQYETSEHLVCRVVAFVCGNISTYFLTTV